MTKPHHPFAVQAICTIPGSSLHGHTVTLWMGKTRKRAAQWLPALARKHGANYRGFVVVDLDQDTGECVGDPPPHGFEDEIGARDAGFSTHPLNLASGEVNDEVPF